MGFLIFAGMIGSILYSSHVIKNEIKAEVADYKCKPVLDYNKNEKNVRDNFVVICKRAGIKLSKDNLPLDESQCNKGMEYLKYKGYDPKSVEYFKKIFNEKYLRNISKTKLNLKNKHSDLKRFLNTTSQEKTLITYRRDYYGHQDPVSRMEKLMENQLWGSIVDNYTYIRSGNSARYTEVWNFRVPIDFFKNTENLYHGKTTPFKLYNEVCWIQGLDNGSFI